MVRSVLGCLALVGVFAVAGCDKGGDPSQSVEGTGEQAVASGPDGAELFSERCASCHGETGLGDGPAGRAIEPSNLQSGDVQARLTDAQIADIVRNGRGRMPPSGVTDDAEIQALVEHVRGLRQ